MFDYAISKRLGSSFVLNVIDDDLTARKASASIVSMILLSIFFSPRVCPTSSILPASLAVPKMRILSLLAMTPAALGIRPALARFS